MKPHYNALYDISNFHLFSQTKYTALRANRSPREAALVARLETLDRRSCKTLLDTGRQSYAAKDTAPAITTFYIQPREGLDGAMSTYLKSVYLEQLKKQKGWRRTGVYQVVDALLTGVDRKPNSTSAAKFLVVHGKLQFFRLHHFLLTQIVEWDSEESAKAAQDTPDIEIVPAKVEKRQWKLYRAWDNTATPPLGRFKPAYPPPGTSEIGDKIRVRRGSRGLTPLDGALLNAPEIAVSEVNYEFGSHRSQILRTAGTPYLGRFERRTVYPVMFGSSW